MDAADSSSELVGRAVFDAAGHRLGRVDSLYREFDDEDISFAAVSMSRRGRRRLVFVPLKDASIALTSITVRCGEQLARDAPQTRPGQALPAELRADLHRHYDIPYQPGEAGSPRLRRCD